MRQNRKGAALVAATLALVFSAAGCTSDTAPSARSSGQPTSASPAPGTGDLDHGRGPERPSTPARTGPLRAPASLVQAMSQGTHSPGAIDATFGPGTFRLWQPRHARNKFDLDTVFQRRMPPCGKAGLWSHWSADEQLRDFHSRLTLRADGSLVATQLGVYPTSTVAHRWMGQFTDQGFGCSAVRTPSGDKPVKSQDLFTDELPRPYDRIVVDETVGQGHDYRLSSGVRGGVRAVAFRTGNAVLLASIWDPANRRPDLEVDTYAAIKHLSRPVIRQLGRHYD
jgi:hypothetical protein